MAQPLGISLGDLDLLSTTTGLQLHLSAELEISKGTETSASGLKRDLLTPDIAQRLFIQRADGFQVVLHVHFGFSLTPTMKDDILEKLGHTLDTATMWSDLQLQSLSINISTSRENISVHLISICLSYTDSTTHAVRKARHKLGIHVPFHVVQPPSGIRTLSLDAVHLAMHVTHNIRREQQTLERDCRASCTLAVADQTGLQGEAKCNQPKHEVHDGVLLSVPVSNMFLGPPRDVDLNAPSAQHELHGHQLPFQSKSPTSSLSSCISLWRPEGGSRLLVSGGILSPMEGTRASVELQPAKSLAFDTLDVVQLIASGLREAIADLPRRRLDGKVTNSRITFQRFQRLSGVAPALFSPRYLSNVSGRAVFLPLLSHALLKVGLKNTNSKSLSSKMRQLLQAEPTIDATTEHDNLEQENLAAKLFCLVQRGVYDPKASRRLQPLIVQSNDLLRSDQEHNSTILEPAEDTQSSQELDIIDDAFDDLHEDVENFESLSVADDDIDDELSKSPHEVSYVHPTPSSQADGGAFSNLDDEDLMLETEVYPSAPRESQNVSDFDNEDGGCEDDLLSLSDEFLCYTDSQPHTTALMTSQSHNSDVSDLESLMPEISPHVWATGGEDKMLLD